MNILKSKPLLKIVNRVYPDYFQILGLIAFILLLTFGIFGSPFPSKNPLTYFIWTLWWSSLPFIVFLSARAWCGVCPLGALVDLTNNINKLNKFKVPKYLWTKGPWLGITLFLLVTWLDWGYGITANPLLTAIFFLFLIILAVIVSLLYSGRLFCKYLCPITPLLKLYAQFSLIEYRGKNVKMRPHFQCPMYISPTNIRNNKECILCFKCLRKRVVGNYGIFIRNPSKELINHVTLPKNERFFLLVLVPLLFLQTFQMSKLYPGLVKKLFLSIPIKSYYLAFTLLFVGLILLFILLYLTVKLTQKLLYKESFEFLFLAIPMVLAAHIFHSIMHLISDLREKLGLIPLGKEWTEIGPFLKLTGFIILTLGFIITSYIITSYIIVKTYHSIGKKIISMLFAGSVFSSYLVLIFMHLGLSHIH